MVVSGRALVQTLEDQAPVGHDHSVPQVLAHLNALLNIRAGHLKLIFLGMEVVIVLMFETTGGLV